MARTPISRHGVHAPNCRLTAYTPGGTLAVYRRIAASKASWVKLLVPDQDPSDGAVIRAWGPQVLVRATGEGTVHHEEVTAIANAWQGVAAAIECGNEPGRTPADLWAHAWYMEQVTLHAPAGMPLITPGWVAGAHLPDGDLGNRLRGVYSHFQGIGVHCYEPYDLAGSQAVHEQLAAWHQAFPDKPLYITEYGIPATSMGEQVKAERYAAFVKGLPDYVEAAFAFLLGGTAEFGHFNGGNSYWLGDNAWAHLGEQIGE